MSVSTSKLNGEAHQSVFDDEKNDLQFSLRKS